jgi:hypothetical protein
VDGDESGCDQQVSRSQQQCRIVEIAGPPFGQRFLLAGIAALDVEPQGFANRSPIRDIGNLAYGLGKTRARHEQSTPGCGT